MTKTNANKNTQLVSKLNKLGLKTSFDFALHLPLRYEDETSIVSISEASQFCYNQTCQVIATVKQQNWLGKQLIIEVYDESLTLNLRFINVYDGQIKQFTAGSKWRIKGEIKHGIRGLEIVHPICKNANIPLPTHLTAIYPSIAGLPQAYLQTCIQNQVKKICANISELIPLELLQQNNLQKLLPLAQALDIIHFPNKNTDIDSIINGNHPAMRRLKFDELLVQQLCLKKLQIEVNNYTSTKFAKNNHLLEIFFQQLPFVLTQGQNKVWKEISNDLQQNKPMQRLLQGDVGSGKTIIAALASCQVIGGLKKNKAQVALMAPTEILAQQLWHKFTEWLKPLDIKIDLLIGSTTAKNKKIIKEKVKSGEIDILIGTHAIIQKDVEFYNLGLAIIDEQHRFGVLQRLSLGDYDQHLNSNTKTKLVHKLMMSATPIPRSLAMSYYANLNISIMHGLPPNRPPIITKLINNKRREEIIQRLKSVIEKKQQIYWVCPLIEESETLELENAINTYKNLCSILGNNIRIDLIHGRLPNKDKEDIMLRFKQHQIDILVATTVIEVGVDVPNASIMVIEHAERFGLAQLHQLRGRIGRGSNQSTCILLYQTPLTPTGNARLKTMYETQDGFIIAQKDLELRGAGEMLGSKQSGDVLRFANLPMDDDLLDLAVYTAKIMLEKYSDSSQQYIDLWVNKKIYYAFA